MLFGLDGDVLAFNVEAQPVIDAHILVRNPDQREERDHITAPIVKNQLVACNSQESCGHVMAQAIFAGKKVKQLAPEPRAALALTLAIFLKFTKNRFVSTGPCDASDGDG